MTAILRAVVLGAVLASVSACVTINIYFPAAAAEKAADRIIDDVWQLHQGANGSVPPKTDGETK